ncbi:MAG TPA: hypothetical protein VFQ82_08500, partial [Stellaceae bacterium]|nr:hypothetical protein [Stellaceae bacterium]
IEYIQAHDRVWICRREDIAGIGSTVSHRRADCAVAAFGSECATIGGRQRWLAAITLLPMPARNKRTIGCDIRHAAAGRKAARTALP